MADYYKIDRNEDGKWIIIEKDSEDIITTFRYGTEEYKSTVLEIKRILEYRMKIKLTRGF